MELLSNLVLYYVAAVVILLIIVIKLVFEQRYSYWRKKGVNSISGKIPFGNLTLQFLNQKSHGEIIADDYVEFVKRKVHYGGIYVITKPVLMPIDPELIKNILVKDFSSFHDRTFTVNVNVDPLAGHLFLLKGAQWRYMRTKLSPTFTSGKIKMMFPTLVTCGNELEKTLAEPVQKAEPIDIKDILARYTTDVIGSCAFGLDCNSLHDPNAEFRKYGRMHFEVSKRESFGRIIASFFPVLNKILRISLVKKSVEKFFMNAIKQTVDYREQNHIERKDFMNLLIKLKNNENIEDDDDDNDILKSSSKVTSPALTFNQLAAQCFVFFVAGFETSSSTMTYCLYELCQNPHIQENLRYEIIQILKKYKGELTYEAILEMNYLDKVIKETLRKYPIVPVLQRECVQDYKIPDSDVTLEKGTAVFIPVLGLHRDPKYYPNPLKFDPERFSEEEKAKRHQYTYLPFGEGPRNCIGMRFGLMQTKVGLVTLLRHYKFTLNSKTILPTVFDPQSFILSVQGGIWLNAQNVVS